MNTWLISFLQWTAWPMTPPVPYSAFHIILASAGICMACVLAWKLRGLKGDAFYRVVFLCGVILALSELYKQLFLYYIVGQGHYDWWYFPFQLCSLPIYFCLLIPLLKGNAFGRVLCTFVMDFGLLGGIMALAEPSGLLHPYWTMTLHGLLWHVMLIFTSLFLAFAGHEKRDLLSYLQMLPVFGVTCIIATVINMLTKGASDMFYISPYYPVTQVVFDKISIRYGTGIGIMLYLLSVCLGGLICHMALGLIHKKEEPS